MSLKPANLKNKSIFFFKYGVSGHYSQYCILWGLPKSNEIFPFLLIPDHLSDIADVYEFSHRDEKAVSFKYLSNGSGSTSKMASYNKKIILSEWREGLSLYFDYLAIKEIENQIILTNSEPKYHVMVDERDGSGDLCNRRLIYSAYSQNAANHILRQDRLHQEYLFEYYNARGMYDESVFTKFYNLKPEFDCTTISKLTVLIEYPHSRRHKPSYSRYWHWYISRLAPPIEDSQPDPQTEQDRVDERWQHRPGDPKLLREHGTGSYGSYPSYEGDEETEYRDEQ